MTDPTPRPDGEHRPMAGDPRWCRACTRDGGVETSWPCPYEGIDAAVVALANEVADMIAEWNGRSVIEADDQLALAIIARLVLGDGPIAEVVRGGAA